MKSEALWEVFFIKVILVLLMKKTPKIIKIVL